MGNLGGLSPQGSVAVGVLVGLISTSFQAIGLTFQRKSHLLEDEKHPYDIRRPPYKRRRWQLGMLMFVVSNIVGSTIQITTLPLPVLSTLQASGLVFNTIFATLILSEPFTRYSLVGTILVCTGAILIATFGAIGEPAHTLDQLLHLLQRRNFILWIIGTSVLVLVILVASKVLKFLASPHARSKHPKLRDFYVPQIQVSQAKVRLVRGLSYGFVSGILSAHSLLLAKSAVELLVRTVVDRVNQFNRWQSWVILIAMIALALTQLFYLHRGLKLCSTSVLYPFVFCIYNIIAIFDGLIYFRQLSQLASFHAGLIALGTIVLLGGVLCLSWRLEDVDSHAAVTVVGPSQTGLGPGMAILEEHPHSPLDLDLDDEERQTGEREPLLRTPQPPTHGAAPHGRTPSLPTLSSAPQRSSTDVDPASIWAELDDSDYDYTAPDAQTSLQGRSALTPFKNRIKSKTGGFSTVREGAPRRVRHSSLSQNTWSPRHFPVPTQGPDHQRRTSAPAPENRKPLQKRQTFGGYGTQEERSDHLYAAGRGTQTQSCQDSSEIDGLAGPRNVLREAWRGGLRYLARFTGRHEPEHSFDPESDPSRTGGGTG